MTEKMTYKNLFLCIKDFVLEAKREERKIEEALEKISEVDEMANRVKLSAVSRKTVLETILLHIYELEKMLPESNDEK